MFVAPRRNSTKQGCFRIRRGRILSIMVFLKRDFNGSDAFPHGTAWQHGDGASQDTSMPRYSSQSQPSSSRTCCHVLSLDWFLRDGKSDVDVLPDGTCSWFNVIHWAKVFSRQHRAAKLLSRRPMLPNQITAVIGPHALKGSAALS